MKSLVIIPTYNERENLTSLLPEIFRLLPQIHILIVDDNSPDGTGQLVKDMQKSNLSLHLLERSGKQGLAKAYLAGFKWGLEKGYEQLIEMDADHSHRPEDLVKIVEALKESDFAMGSRWVKGGATADWSLSRKFISRGGSLYTRFILGFGIRDWTGGFNGWHARVLQGINLDEVRSQGYSFQIELKYRATRRGFRGIEVPIFFADRQAGESKMSGQIVLEALHRVWELRNVV